MPGESSSDGHRGGLYIPCQGATPGLRDSSASHILTDPATHMDSHACSHSNSRSAGEAPFRSAHRGLPVVSYTH